MARKPPPSDSLVSALSPAASRVLIVDDDALSRSLAESLLQSSGYRLRTCASGEEALEALEEEVPDLVLLDVLMPGMDGFEVCRRLRERLHLDYVPVILVTAMDDRKDLVRGLEVGADDFLRKPVHGAELRARVSNLLKVRAYHRLLASQRDHALATVEQLRQQILRVDRLAMLGTFAAGVSHELNNIAHVLHSALELTRPGVTPPPVGDELEPQKLFAHVSNHVTELSRTLLRIARPDEGPGPEANLCRVLEEVDQMLRLTGRTRHAQVSLVLPEAPCLIRGNPVHAQQVFLNLLGNAADAVGAVNGPTIEAGVRRREDGRIEAWVKDNGPGMTPEVQARIFEPFFTTKPPGSGTGLGLPVVKQLVESWGGHLQVDSQPGSGTRMVIELPAGPTP